MVWSQPKTYLSSKGKFCWFFGAKKLTLIRRRDEERSGISFPSCFIGPFRNHQKPSTACQNRLKLRIQARLLQLLPILLPLFIFLPHYRMFLLHILLDQRLLLTLPILGCLCPSLLPLPHPPLLHLLPRLRLPHLPHLPLPVWVICHGNSRFLDLHNTVSKINAFDVIEWQEGRSWIGSDEETCRALEKVNKLNPHALARHFTTTHAQPHAKYIESFTHSTFSSIKQTPTLLKWKRLFWLDNLTLTIFSPVCDVCSIVGSIWFLLFHFTLVIIIHLHPIIENFSSQALDSR